MPITVAEARSGDIAAVVLLLEEMERQYGAPEAEPLAHRTGEIAGWLFGPVPAARVLLARDGGAVAGMAAYSYLWPAVGPTASLYLKELYVAVAHRRRGVGRLLMDRVFAIAREAGCSRVDWTTDRGNADAQAFYAKLGAREHHGKVLYRVDL